MRAERHTAPPESEIIVRMFAREKARDREGAMREFSERQQAKRLAVFAEGGDEQRFDAFLRADMFLPEIQKIRSLIRREVGADLERAP